MRMLQASLKQIRKEFMAVRIIATADDFKRIQEQSLLFVRRSSALQARVSSLQGGTSSLEQLDRQVRDIERISADAQKLYQDMEEFKNRSENREVFHCGAGIDLAVVGFNMMQNGIKLSSGLAETFKRDDVPWIRACLRPTPK